MSRGPGPWPDWVVGCERDADRTVPGQVDAFVGVFCDVEDVLLVVDDRAGCSGAGVGLAGVDVELSLADGDRVGAGGESGRGRSRVAGCSRGPRLVACGCSRWPSARAGAWARDACEAGGREVERKQGGEAPAEEADVGGQSEHEAGQRNEG